MSGAARDVEAGESWAFTEHRSQADVKPDEIAYLSDLPIGKVQPDPSQPRKTFKPETIADLAASIREKGLLQPIVVRPADDGFYIVFGERRYRAHLHNKAKTIRAEVLNVAPGIDVLVMQIIENDQREDVTPLEQAHAYQRLIDDLGGNVELAAKKLGKAPHRLTERTCLLRLQPEYQQLLVHRQLKPTEAFEMAALSARGQERLFQAIKNGKCPNAKSLRAVSQAMHLQEAQVSIFDMVPAPPPPTPSERAAASRLERKIAQVSDILALGFNENEIVAAKRVDPGRAAVYADKLRLIQRHLAAMEVALRTSAVTGDLFATRESA